MSRKRWIKRILAGLLAFGAAGGCRQQVFIDPADYKDAVLGSLPPGLETSPHQAILPSQVNRLSGVPHVLDPNRPAKLMTLKECIAIALEQGNRGVENPGVFDSNSRTKTDQPNQFTGQGVTGTDAIRAFAVDPALVATELERSLSKFDARWVSSMNWQKIDQPTPAQFLSFQNTRDAAQFSTTLAKPLPTGGTAGITFSVDYSKFATQSTTLGGFVNPNYTPRLQFSFEQPLLRLFGTEINQLSSFHPGSQLLNVGPSGGQGTEGILIARIRLDQQKAEFDRAINYTLANVEAAYWSLYAAYYNLYAQEEGLRQAFEGYRFVSGLVAAGRLRPQDQDQARAQFERFRGFVYRARGQVLESERQLRGHLGLRSDDGVRIVPIDEPNQVAYVPDFYEAANEALANRPELLQARQDLKANQLNLLLQKNLRRPDLRVFGQYDIAGLGTRLDGSEFGTGGLPGNALTSLGNNDFNSWTIGLRMDIPIGFRDANALVRASQLQLARSFYQLRDSEMKVLEYLVFQYRRVIETHALIGPLQRERIALQIFVGKTAEVIRIGQWDTNAYQQYLTVQRDLATAIAEEFQAIADYNAALAAFEFAKGTIQRYNNVSVNEGPLPPWVQKKAADHIRERTEHALKLRERECLPAGGPGVLGGFPIGPPTGTAALPELPPFAEKRDPVPESLPDPTPMDPKNIKPEIPPFPIPQGELGTRAVPGGGAIQPVQPPVPTATPPGEDYFKPVGRVSFPAWEPPGNSPAGSATTRPVASNSAPAPLPFSAGTGMTPLLIPPTGASLPIPPSPGDGSGNLPPIPRP
jgi:outer membrane protein TolC